MNGQTQLGDAQATNQATEATAPKAESKTPTPKKQEILTRGDKAEIVKQIKTEATGLMNPIEYEQAKVVARDIVASKAAPKSFENENQVLMAVLAGREMGMSPMQALQSLYFVNGALNLWGKALPRRLREHGYTLGYQEETPNSCTCVVKNKGNTEMYTETYTFDEARDSGYTHQNGNLKIGWKPGINRKLKLRYGAISLLIKTYIPEVMGSAAGIVEVDEDYNPASHDNNDRTAINDALAKAKPADLADTKAVPVEQEQ